MTRSPVEARRASVDDLDDLLLLWSQAREDPGRSGRLVATAPLEQFRARLLDSLAGGGPIILIGRYEGAAAGYAVLRLAPVLLVESGALHVEQLFVVPALRRRGIARALLLVATSIAERNGAEQVLAGAPPSARESHRFLARLGFAPFVTRRVVGTAALRRRLTGEAQRRGLDDLLSRRRSLRARSLRAGRGRQVEQQPPAAPPPDEPRDAAPVDAGPVPTGPVPTGPVPTGPAPTGPDPDAVPARDPAPLTLPPPEGGVERIDLSRGDDLPGGDTAAEGQVPAAPGRRRGRQRA